ncbi:hypothetical protein ACET3Z_026412 [Daucus carota]
MDQEDEDSSISPGPTANPKPNLNLYHRIINSPVLHSSSSLEIRLFYVRITPCAVDYVPDHLTLCHLRREIGVSLDINSVKIPASERSAIALRRDRVDKENAEVTYVSTDSVRVTGAVEFEVLEEEEMVLCGSLERIEGSWSGEVGSGWSMACYIGGIANGSGDSAFFKPKLGISSPSIEVYIAGCCSGVPVILTKTIQVSPRKKNVRHGMLDAIPEDEEVDKERRNGNGLVQNLKIPVTDAEVDDYDPDGKFGQSYYSDDMYPVEDGQLTWFNAGVRVGVGIGLGMCLGVGIGVGLLMRSYQATTRNFRRRFF